MKNTADRVDYFLDKVEQIWNLPVEKMVHRAKRLRNYKEAILKEYEAAK